MSTIKLTQTQINESIYALEEASRILNKLGSKTVTAKEIDNLKEEVQSAWETLSKAQHKQIFAV